VKKTHGSPSRRDPPPRTPLEEVVHELRVHQVELEAQNEELKRVQLELEESRDRYLDLYDFAPIGYFSLGAGGEILDANLHGASQLGLPRDVLKGTRFERFVPSERVPAWKAHLEVVLGDSRPLVFEVPLVRQDGTRFAARLDSASLKAAPEIGRVARVAITDVSEHQRAEEERLELQRQSLQIQKLESLALLAGGVAHDFNNLLTSVLGNLVLVRGDLAPDSAARTRLDKAASATERAAALTRQLLAYSGGARFSPERVELGLLVRNHVPFLRSLADPGVEVSLRLAGEPVTVLVDPGQMQQVITSLFANAAESIGARPGTVVLATGSHNYEAAELERGAVESARAPGRYGWVDVSDTGTGMDDSTLKRLFEPFFSTKVVGRGLGMPAVLGIVKAHGGTLLVDSKWGRGTTIRVLIPSVALEERRAGPRSRVVPLPQAIPEGPATVLVVDDEEIVREVAVSLLDFLGYRSLSAANGAAALEIFRTHPEITVVMLDLTMPGMNGAAVFAALREQRPDVKVLFCSGYDLAATGGHEGAEKPAGFLQKPYTVEDLEVQLRLLVPSKDES
jgi:PAS domain S-box-containing protein